MKYLFFDIECANCFKEQGKICEFGYVETDEKFNEIASDEYLINPDAPFDWYVMKKMLAYPKELYLSKSKYPTYFPQIKALFEDEEIAIFGHTVDADAKYLNDEAKRYNLPFFNYTFYDVKEMYSAYANSKKGVSLEKIGDILGSKNRGHAHRAIDDARSTMLAAKKMCETLEMNLMQLTLLCERSVGQTKDGVISTVAKAEAEQRRIVMEKEEQTALKFSTKENTGNSIGDIIGEQLQCFNNNAKADNKS